MRGNLKLARSSLRGVGRRRISSTVQNAFREVSDSLIAYQQRTQEFRAKQQERTQAHRDATDMANVRYDGGVTSYLEVLYNEQELFRRPGSPRPGAAQRVAERWSQLYRAPCGGGWELDGPSQAKRILQ